MPTRDAAAGEGSELEGPLLDLYRGSPLRSRAQHRQDRAVGVVFFIVWLTVLIGAVIWLDGFALLIVGVILMIVNPAGFWGESYEKYREEWETANEGGLADAEAEHVRVLGDGSVVRVAKLPDGNWQAWLDGDELSGMGTDLPEVIWAACGHQPSDGPAPWMYEWSTEVETSAGNL